MAYTNVGQYDGLTGLDSLSSLLNLQSPYSILELDANNNLIGQVLTNGQLLVGSTGGSAVATVLTGSGNLVVTNGAGSISLDTVQPIQATSSPSFAGLTLSGLTNTALVATNGVDALQSVLITNGNGTNVSFGGSTLAFSMTQNLSTVGTPSFAGLALTGLTASMPLHTNALMQLVSGLISLTSDVAGVLPVANGGTNSSTALAGGDIMISSGGKIIEGTSATSPTFTGTLTAGQVIASSAYAQPLTANNTTVGGNIAVALEVGGYTVTTFGYIAGTGIGIYDFVNTGWWLTQIGGVKNSMQTFNNILDDGAGNATFLGLTDSGLTANALVYANGSKKLLSLPLTAGQILIGTAGAPSATTLTAGLNMSITSTSGSIVIASSVGPVFTGTVTVGNLIDSGVGPNAILCTNGSSQLSTMTVTGSNGITSSFAGGTQTISLLTTASPTLTGLTLSGLTNSALVATDGSNDLQSVTIANAGGCNTTYSAGTLTFSMTQNLAGGASPSFVGLSLSGLSGTALVATTGASALQSVTLANSNGCNTTFSAGTLTSSMSQNLASTASPTFAELTLTTGVLLPTTGGTATALAYYEEYNHVTTWSGPIATTAAITCPITRVGRMVTIKIPSVNGTGNGTSSNLSMTTSPPARFCPTVQIYCEYGLTANNGVFSNGYFLIQPSGAGAWFFGQGLTGPFAANTGSTGLFAVTTYTYSV